MSEAVIRRMTDALRHRGPDDEGLYIGGGVGLGMRRLSIIDLETGHQPIANEDGTVRVVLNGEIYNYRELTADLCGRGHQFHTKSDAEPLVHAYEEYGDGFIEKLWGMFAFALWDEKHRRLIVARDRLGKKPLYWTHNGGRLAWASELKAFRCLEWFDTTPNVSGLETYLAVGFIPAPATIFEGTSKLRAGEMLVWQDGRVRTSIYWDLPLKPRACRSRAEAVEAVRELLSDAVRRRLQSDVPVGALLSGGIDSSTVVALMAEHASLVDTYTIAFPEQELDESADARRVAELFGTRHHELVVETSLVDTVRRLAWFLDEPLADNAAIPTFLIAEAARAQVKVLLSGEGGDEAFGGYRYYSWEKLAHQYRALVRSLDRIGLGRSFQSALRAVPSWKLRQFAACAIGPDPTGLGRWQSLSPVDPGIQLLNHDLAASCRRNDPLAAYGEAYLRRDDRNLLNRLMYVDAKVFLADDLLAKVDRTTMAHSLEARNPFLDHRLLELLASLPSAWKLRPGSGTAELLAQAGVGAMRMHARLTKPLLRDAASRWLPPDVCRRPKRVFGTPLPRWLRDELCPLTGELFAATRGGGSGMLDPAALAVLHRRFLEGEDRLARLVWAALVLELWARAWRNGGPA